MDNTKRIIICILISGGLTCLGAISTNATPKVIIVVTLTSILTSLKSLYDVPPK